MAIILCNSFIDIKCNVHFLQKKTIFLNIKPFRFDYRAYRDTHKGCDFNSNIKH